MTPEFPTLYKKSGTGAIQYWRIAVIENSDHSVGYDIVSSYGQEGGKEQTAIESIFEGKNIGRANETTPEQQAIAEAKSKWELQKKKKGYVETIEAALAGEVDALVQGGIFPMLAQKFEKQADKVEYPAFVQPKFDGHRCIAVVKDGKCTLWSRTRKPINSVPHINKAIEELVGPQANIMFDGELYNHEYHNNFEQITKLIRPAQPVPGHEKVEYYIYDLPTESLKFAERNLVLNALFSSGRVGPLVPVETFTVESEAEVPLAFDRFFSAGYEGAMLRTADNLYDGHPTRRSKGLLKLKKFDDAEFEIVDVVEGTGKMAGKAIFVCRAGNGETFEAVMNDTLEKLQEYWQHREALIGMLVTVQFQGFTTKKGVPRFPRALRLRDDL